MEHNEKVILNKLNTWKYAVVALKQRNVGLLILFQITYEHILILNELLFLKIRLNIILFDIYKF